MTYEYFIADIKNNVNLMLINYTITDSQLDILINTIYNDITSSVSLMQFNQIIKLEKGVDTYDLDSLLYLDSNDDTQMLGVYKIQTLCGITVFKCWTEVCRNTFCMVDNDVCNYECYPDATVDDIVGKYIVFSRHVIPDIKKLTQLQQVLIMNAMIQGIVERATQMIPSPTGSGVPMQEESYRQSIYEKEKTKLLNKLPQYI